MDLFFTPIPLVQDEFDPGSYGNTLFMCILYVSLGRSEHGVPISWLCLVYNCLPGTVAIAANLLNIVVFWTNKELRTNYVFIIALDIGEIINGLSYILTGLGRGTQLLLGNYHRPITVHDCFFTVSQSPLQLRRPFRLDMCQSVPLVMSPIGGIGISTSEFRMPTVFFQSEFTTRNKKEDSIIGVPDGIYPRGDARGGHEALQGALPPRGERSGTPAPYCRGRLRPFLKKPLVLNNEDMTCARQTPTFLFSSATGRFLSFSEPKYRLSSCLWFLWVRDNRPFNHWILLAERVYAVHRPGLYNRYFTLRLKVTVVVLMVLVQLVR